MSSLSYGALSGVITLNCFWSVKLGVQRGSAPNIVITRLLMKHQLKVQVRTFVDHRYLVKVQRHKISDFHNNIWSTMRQQLPLIVWLIFKLVLNALLNEHF